MTRSLQAGLRLLAERPDLYFDMSWWKSTVGFVGVVAVLVACGSSRTDSGVSDLPPLTTGALVAIAEQNPTACAFVDLTEGQETVLTSAAFLTQLKESGPDYDKYIGAITPGPEVLGFQCLGDAIETAKFLKAQASKAGFAANVYIKDSNGALKPS